MARWVYVATVFVSAVLLMGDVVEASKDKKGKPTKRRVTDIVTDLEANVTALWHEVDMLQQPVHVHIHGHGGDLTHEHHHDDHVDHHHGHHDNMHTNNDGDDGDDIDGMAAMDAPDKKSKKDKKEKKLKKGNDDGDDGEDDKNEKNDKNGKNDDDDDTDMDKGHMGHGHMGHKHHGHMGGMGHMGHKGPMGHMGHKDHMGRKGNMGHGPHEGMHHGGHSAHVHIHLHTDGDDKKATEELFYKDLSMDEYVYARCDMVPNLALQGSQPHIDLKGSVYFRQKPKQPLQVSVDLSGLNVDHASPGGQKHHHMHGMHGHEFGDVSNDCNNQGGHFNPTKTAHGGHDAAERHPGDFGNIHVDEFGFSSTTFNDTLATLIGPHSLLGRGVVLHAGPDDLGMEDTEASKKTGNAGARIACCAIVISPAHSNVWPDDQ